MILTVYKLLRKRKNGTFGPLFINRRQIIPVGEWLPSENHPTKGYALRPGWHTTLKPEAPHLTMNGRVWMKVEISDYKKLVRPKNQGGIWWLSKWIRIIEEV